MTIRREHPRHAWTDDRQTAFASLVGEWRGGAIDRRSFLIQGAALLTVAALPVVVHARAGKATTAAELMAVPYTTEPWRTLAAVQEHLFPTTGDAPGATEIHATAYLKAALAEPDMDPDNREFTENGVTWLNDIARQQQQTAFADLDEEQRESVLRSIEKTAAGRRWIGLLLLFIFEALLGDPIYGGNPGGIGWQWLEHQPGFPRPPARHTYQELKKL